MHRLSSFSRWTAGMVFLALMACTPKEFVMQQPPASPSAKDYPQDDAVYLLRKTNIVVSGDGLSYREDSHHQIKALQARGVKHTQNAYVYYMDKHEEVSDFHFRVIRPGGSWISRNLSMVDAPSSKLFSSRYFSDLRWKGTSTAFGVPSVEQAVMEYRYTKTGNSWMIGAVWLQTYLPVHKAIYTISIPANITFRHKLFEGSGIPSSQVKYEKRTDPNDSSRILHRWEVSQVPAVRLDDPASPPWNARVLRVYNALEARQFGSHQGTARTWDDIAAFYRSLIENRDQPTPMIRKTVADITKNAKTQNEKIRAVYKFVNEKIRYIAVGIGLGGWQPQSAEFTLIQRYGDCKAKATLLKSMLSVIGVESHHVLVRTRGLGSIDEQIPADFGIFNHAINYVPGIRGGMYMDSTNVGTPFGYLPGNDWGASALIVEKNKGRLVRIKHASGEGNIKHLRLELTRSKTQIEGVLTLRWLGKFSLSTHKKIEDKELDTAEKRTNWGKGQVSALFQSLAFWTSLGADTNKLKIVQVSLEDKEDTILSQITFSIPTVKSKQRVLYVPMLWAQTGGFSDTLLLQRKQNPVFRGLSTGIHINEVIFNKWDPLEVPAPASFSHHNLQYQLTSEKRDQYASYRREIKLRRADISLAEHNDFRGVGEKILEADRRIVILRKGYGDKDKDGVPDNIDKCPTEPGPKELGGCPDRDGDGIIDKEDACPDVKGVKSNDPKKHGCPEVVLVVVTKTEIKILQKIFFRTGRADIQKRSFPVLDQVAEVLGSQKEIRVLIEGHTDNVGNKRSNLQLSKRRAASVKKYLINKGLAAERLESEGYGMSKPLVPNTNRQNKAKNRRVQFTILPKK